MPVLPDYLTSNNTLNDWFRTTNNLISYISDIETGTIPDANSSTSGLVNTSAQSLAGVKTFVNAIAVGANVSINTSAIFVGNTVSNLSYTATSLSIANSTNTATLTPISLTIGTTVANTTTVTATNLSGNGSSVTSVNAIALGGKTEANLNVNNATTAYGKLEGALSVASATQATNATNLNSQPASYYTNASNLSTGTIPGARISGEYTGVTSLAIGANVVANVTTVFVGNSTVNVSHTATQLSVANSTNTATLTPISLTIGTQAINTTGIYTATLTVNTSPREKITLSATSANGTINFDTLTQGILHYTVNAAANWTLNIRGNSTATLNSIISNGQSMTVTFVVPQGTTAYYANAHQLDGGAITPKWQGGAAPFAGNPSSYDAYTYTIMKTADTPTWVVLASLTKFA